MTGIPFSKGKTMSKVIYDLMTIQDVEQVAQIEQSIFSMPWSKKSFAETIEKDMTIYVSAKEDDIVVGYCGIWISFDEAEITNVAVAEQARRKNIAFKMLEYLMELAKEKGVTKFMLEVRESNYCAIGLYEKLGFVNVGIRKNFYAKPTENAIIMWKE